MGEWWWEGRLWRALARRMAMRRIPEIMASESCDEAVGVLPGIRGVAVERVTVGHRVMPADEYPIVGFSDACPNLYVAAMHSGVTLAPLIGQLAALEILDGARVSSLEPYRPSRFSRLIRYRQQSRIGGDAILRDVHFQFARSGAGGHLEIDLVEADEAGRQSGEGDGGRLRPTDGDRRGHRELERRGWRRRARKQRSDWWRPGRPGT